MKNNNLTNPSIMLFITKLFSKKIILSDKKRGNNKNTDNTNNTKKVLKINEKNFSRFDS